MTFSPGMQTGSVSHRIFTAASQCLVGGVTAGARANSLFATPFYAARAAGSRITDVDGNEYLDLHTSFGAALLGHGHPRIVAAIQDALAAGILCAMETETASIAAGKLVKIIPCAEKVRFTGTGTETTYAVIKLARAFTKRDVVIKFEGHFHGFNDYLQYNFWPPRGQGLPALYVESQGAPADIEKNIVVLPFNDTGALEKTLRARHAEIAAVIMEPVNFNSGGIRPRPDFLAAVRALTKQHGIVLIFDEILSGFRTGPGCMQAHLGVTPDLCTLGKALAAGMPLSAFAGRAEIMDHLSPLGKVSHSGTYLAHPTAIHACNAFLDEIARPDFWPDLLQRTDRLCAGLRQIIAQRGVKCWLSQTGARFCFLFGADREPTNYREMVDSRDSARTGKFFQSAMAAGVFTWAGYHHGISAAHTDADVDEILNRLDTCLKEIA
ncbi:MAG: Glutamate-1-semialdehyde 2,1-aminomutase [Verrucomicrobiae bacterium]|nr:Glutamate-1-semialdehyde 2,1-aminomutase [Verrucomicrobiae bacterium]